MDLIDLGQVPEACTLPTAERPLRLEEFDRLFAGAVTSVERVTPEQLRIMLRPEPDVAAEIAGLAARETRCCSFFTFVLTASVDRLLLDVTVPSAHTAVLDTLARRAAP